MHDYIVEAKSRSDLRAYALQIRANLGMQDQLFFPVVSFLELMPELFPKFHYEIVDDCVFESNIHADTDILEHCIRIKNSVYEGACEGNGRDRMTIAHEIGHYLTLCICGFKLQRNFGNRKLKAYLDPEWQAKCFAGELLVPSHLVNGMDDISLVEKCGVSLEAARKQLRAL